MVVVNQPFERLIKLDDEELSAESNIDINVQNLNASDSCNVPLIEDLNLATTKFRSGNNKKNASSGLQFTINGQRIQMNADQLKYLSLITLTVQNAALNLTMRAANTQTEKFSTPVAVTIAEIFKLITCLLLIVQEQGSLGATCQSLRTHIFDEYIDTLKVAVPSFVYYIQNNLLYVASTHLDAATNQVTYQLKILTTAIFSVVMLNKKLHRVQWLSLLLLFLGVALIETMLVSDHKNPTFSSKLSKTTSATAGLEDIDGVPSTPELGINQNKQSKYDRVENPLLGFVAVLIACCLSGFAGVYFEKILKNSAQVSLWVRNIQLSVVAIPIGLLQLLIVEREHLVDRGIFHGFTPLTWLCIILQAQGGLLVAVVVKFANNILKGFATSMAIVISTVASMFLFNFQLTPTFMLGASLVIGSVMMYNKQH